MKKLFCIMMAMVWLANCQSAKAERTEHQKTMLGILTSSAKANETFEDAYYDENNDTYVLIVKDEEINSELFNEILKDDETFLEKKEKICKDNLCEYFMDWMDMFSIDIPVVIKHVTSDDVLMFCMKDGVRYDYDILEKKELKDDEISVGTLRIMMTMLENSFKEEEGIILETNYNEETKEAWFKFVMLDVDKNYMKSREGRQFKEQMESEFAQDFYPAIKEKFNGCDIEGMSMIIELATKDGETITISKDGKEIK